MAGQPKEDTSGLWVTEDTSPFVKLNAGCELVAQWGGGREEGGTYAVGGDHARLYLYLDIFFISCFVHYVVG
jgi:hypothetical protein